MNDHYDLGDSDGAGASDGDDGDGDRAVNGNGDILTVDSSDSSPKNRKRAPCRPIDLTTLLSESESESSQSSARPPKKKPTMTKLSVKADDGAATMGLTSKCANSVPVAVLYCS
jgi:hypothetical protein